MMKPTINQVRKGLTAALAIVALFMIATAIYNKYLAAVQTPPAVEDLLIAIALTTLAAVVRPRGRSARRRIFDDSEPPLLLRGRRRPNPGAPPRCIHCGEIEADHVGIEPRRCPGLANIQSFEAPAPAPVCSFCAVKGDKTSTAYCARGPNNLHSFSDPQVKQ